MYLTVIAGFSFNNNSPPALERIDSATHALAGRFGFTQEFPQLNRQFTARAGPSGRGPICGFWKAFGSSSRTATAVMNRAGGYTIPFEIMRAQARG
jgi:hypothetical protein